VIQQWCSSGVKKQGLTTNCQPMRKYRCRLDIDMRDRPGAPSPGTQGEGKQVNRRREEGEDCAYGDRRRVPSSAGRKSRAKAVVEFSPGRPGQGRPGEDGRVEHPLSWWPQTEARRGYGCGR
jgi:hypothetical protein